MKEVIKVWNVIETLKCNTDYIKDDCCLSLIDDYIRGITNKEINFCERFPNFAEEVSGIHRHTGYQFPSVRSRSYHIDTWIIFEPETNELFVEITISQRGYSIM